MPLNSTATTERQPAALDRRTSIPVRLLAGGAIVFGAAIYLASVSASSWKYYVTADECVADQEVLKGCRLRVSGTVAPGSLQVNSERTLASFTLAGKESELFTRCAGALPDNIREGIDVVVEGRLEPDGTLHGDKVLTKCASKYDEARSSEPSRAESADRGASE